MTKNLLATILKLSLCCFMLFIFMHYAAHSQSIQSQQKKQGEQSTTGGTNTLQKTEPKSSIVITSGVQAKPVSPVQQNPSHRVLNWKTPVETSVSETENIRTLFFDGATYDENRLPVYYESIALSNSNTPTAIIENAVYEPLSSIETEIWNAESGKLKITSDVQVKSELGFRKKKPYAIVTIFPFRKSAIGTVEKLVSFDLKTSQEPNAKYQPPSPSVQRVYASNSVLASGDWYKVGVVQKGLYKITYDFLKKTGIDVDKINPRNISLYGNGGGQLPYKNETPRYDDLQENAIYVQGETDGKFDKSDYILFYGQMQTTWKNDTTDKQFHHSVNVYSDTTFYFLTLNSQPGKRIPSRPSGSSPNQTITSFDDYDYHEADLINFLKSGREWYGETFDNSHAKRDFTFSMPNILATDTLCVRAEVLGRSFGAQSTFKLYLNDVFVDLKTTPITNPGVTADYGAETTLAGCLLTGNPDLKISVAYSSNDQGGQGWLNYLEFNCRRALSYSDVGNQLFFRDKKTVGTSNTGEFVLSNALQETRIFDVTDPINIEEQQSTFANNQVSFIYSTSSLREYLAFTGTNFPAPISAGRVQNQNLHALKQSQLLIVTNPLFLTQANELAAFHQSRDGYSSSIATTTQIFNEFGSGSQDASAIRDFAKMFYDRKVSGSPDSLRFLLLLGDGSYDNKNRLAGNTDFVTTYQSESSLNGTTSYVSDDFFGLLDDKEGEWSPYRTDELLDISVGRLPVKTVAEAETMVKKILSYGSPDSSSIVCTSCSTSTTVFGDWRNMVTFVGDDQDQNTHFSQSEGLSTIVKTNYPVYNIDKIYLDAYKQEATPGGQRYPDARSAIVNKVERGTLLMTYVGHGGPVGWAHERALENEDINNWTNFKQLAAFLTATCDFSNFDDPARVSAGELVLLNPNGGGICLYTTTRLAFSGSNYNLAQKFFSHVFEPINGLMPTLGEVFEKTKVDYNDRYVRNFVLLGDPALRLAYPKFNIATKTINTHPVTMGGDTLKALSKVTITGEVRDKSGNKMTSFDGTVYPTVYDKWATYHTLGNDYGFTGDGGSSYIAPFGMEKNILYKGKSNVKGGDFSFTFVVPKDISYNYGFGKLSYYAQNGQVDANGYDTSIVIGGLNSLAEEDKQGPEVKLYMNDEKFVFGGVTDGSPVLYAVVHDSNGINTIGNGIGHDITSVLDANNAGSTVLNNYYEADLNSYQSGTVRYPYSSLAEGRHAVTLKVWDVYNNSSEARTEFIVASTAEVALEHVLNYPNPFTTHTTFMFEHNRACSQLYAQVQIFTLSGRLIKTLDRTILSEGYRSNEIQWDGLDDYGDRIGKGVYIYKLRVKAIDGSSAEKFEKLVILR